jgi:hypothetical protein
MIDGLVDLYTVLNAVQQHNETAIGYRIETRGDQAMKKFDMTLNPTKSKLTPICGRQVGGAIH